MKKQILLCILFCLLRFCSYAQAPVITTFTPTTGPVGTLVTITGTNLSSPTAFTIGGVSAIAVSNNGTTLVGLVMPGATTGSVSLTTSGGTATGSGNFTISATPFPSAQQGAKLVGTGAVGEAAQGWSVSLSADGNTALVGGSEDNNDTAAAWVFTRSGGIWTQQGAELVGTGAVGRTFQGTSVSLSADGNTALVGGRADNIYTGAVWVFTRSGGVWTQQGAKLVGTGYVGDASQGYSVSLSADGNTALVGGFGDNIYTGAVWVFTRSGGVWTQQGAKLVGTGYVGEAFQGYSVSLSADGNTALVGGYTDNTTGAAWVFTRLGSVWTQQGAKLVGTGVVGEAEQGWSVSLSADGNTALVGGAWDNSGAGAAWVFTRSGSVWTQQGAKLVGTGVVVEAEQGSSVSLSADGNTALVGGSGDNNNTGAAWVFTRSGGIWTQQGAKLVGTGAVGESLQGGSVSLSADGNTALVGGQGDNSGAGAAWVYTWIYTGPTITPDSSAANVCFSSSSQSAALTYSATTDTPVTYSITWNATPPNNFAAVNNASLPASPIQITVPANTTANTYTGVITVTNAAGVTGEGASFTVTVDSLLTATIDSSGPLTFCAGDSVVLSTTATNGYTYQWQGSGFNITGATETVYVARTSGNYTVIINSAICGSVTSNQVSVTVNSAPASSATALSSTTFCQGDSVILAASSGNSYLWSNSDTTQSVTARDSGTYSVKVTYSDGCSAISDTVAVTVYSLPGISISLSVSPPIICAGDNEIITSTATGSGLTYQWLRNDTGIPGNISNIDTVRQAGIYAVQVTNANGCNALSQSVPVSVTAPPQATVTANGSRIFCAGDSVVLSADTGTDFVYKWEPLNLTGSASGSTFAVKQSGSYTVIVMNNCGADTSSPVTVISDAIQQVTIKGNSPVCLGDTIALNTTATDGISPCTYTWSSPDAAALGNDSNSIRYPSTLSMDGIYYVTVTDSAGCTGSASFTVNLFSPIVSMQEINASSPTSPDGSAWVTTQSGNYLYAWSTGDNTDTISLLLPGEYYVTVSNNSGCMEDDSVAVSYGTGIQSAGTNSGLKVYPNPANDILYLEFATAAIAEIAILDINGKTVKTVEVNANINPVDISDLAAAEYVVSVFYKSGGQMRFLQFTKK